MACAAAGAAAALVPAAHGWTRPQRLASGAKAPIYVSDAHGRFYALFARNSGSVYQLFFDRLGRHGGRGSAERVDAPSAPAGGDFSLAMAPDGSGIAVWCSQDPNGQASPGVYAALRRPGGRFGTPRQLAAPVPSSSVGDSCSTEAAAGSGGALLAIWHRTGTPGNTLDAAVAPAGATEFGLPQRLDDFASRPDIDMTGAVDSRGRATVAWLSGSNALAARQAAPGGPFAVARAAAGACRFGPAPLRLASSDGGAAALLFARCASGGNRVFELARAAPGAPFHVVQRIARTRYPESQLVVNRRGRLAVTWRSVHGHLYAGTGTTAGGIAACQRLTARGAPRYRPGVDAHSAAIDARGHVLVAWRERSLTRRAAVRVRVSDAHGHFGRHVASFRAPGAVGVGAATNAAGDVAVAWNQPRRGRDRIVAAVRRRGYRFRAPQPVVGGRVEPVGLLASGNSLLLAWVTQPSLAATVAVGDFGR